MRSEEEGGRGKTKERDIATNLEATAWRKHVLLLFKVAFLLFFLFFVCGRVIECLCEFLLGVVLVLEVVCVTFVWRGLIVWGEVFVVWRDVFSFVGDLLFLLTKVAFTLQLRGNNCKWKQDSTSRTKH